MLYALPNKTIALSLLIFGLVCSPNLVNAADKKLAAEKEDKFIAQQFPVFWYLAVSNGDTAGAKKCLSEIKEQVKAEKKLSESQKGILFNLDISNSGLQKFRAEFVRPNAYNAAAGVMELVFSCIKGADRRANEEISNIIKHDVSTQIEYGSIQRIQDRKLSEKSAVGALTLEVSDLPKVPTLDVTATENLISMFRASNNRAWESKALRWRLGCESISSPFEAKLLPIWKRLSEIETGSSKDMSTIFYLVASNGYVPDSAEKEPPQLKHLNTQQIKQVLDDLNGMQLYWEGYKFLEEAEETNRTLYPQLKEQQNQLWKTNITPIANLYNEDLDREFYIAGKPVKVADGLKNFCNRFFALTPGK